MNEFNIEDINMLVLLTCVNCGKVKKNTLMGEMFPEQWIEVLQKMVDEPYLCGKCTEGLEAANGDHARIG